MSNNHINKEWSRKAIGLILAAFTLVSMTFLGSLPQGAILAAAFLICGFIRIELKYTVSNRIVELMFAVVTAVYTFVYSRRLFMEMKMVFQLERRFIIINVVIVLILMIAVMTLTLQWRLSVLTGSLAVILIATINYYVYKFRGYEFTFSDILAAKTAATVVRDYKITFPFPLVRGWFMWALLMFAMFTLIKKEYRRKVVSRLIFLVIGLGMVIWLGNTMKDDTMLTWRNEGTIYRGYFYNVLLNFRDTRVTKPEGYSEEALEKISEEYKTSAAVTDDVEKDYPTIIAIMDESFADLSVLGSEVNTDTELLPFYNSLTENTIKGYALASQFGGGTANSEYEFLTGNSKAFFPQNSIVYQQYIKQDTYNLVTYLESLGYSSMATHPYSGSNWARETVYPLMGFDRATFKKAYPHKKMVRTLVSDEEMFDYLIEQYEKGKSSGPQFIFGITMQNHGGYTDEMDATVHLNGYSQNYPEVEQYLSLANLTDQSVEALINYFSNSEENVIIVFFGDHLPNLPISFLEQVHGGPFDTLDEQELMYKVPFFIWTNYDIPEQTVECTSLNYLSNYLLTAAGIEYPLWNKFLANVMEQYPAINAAGFYSAEEQSFLPVSEMEAEPLLMQYDMLAYNSLFDKANRNQDFFPY